jgi:hypothetical protein
MAGLVRHAAERHTPADGRLLRYRDGRPVTYRRYDGLWVRIGRHLPWARTQRISTHWLRHTTLTWVERNFGFAIAHAYAGHTDGAADTGTATSTYVRATLTEVATAAAYEGKCAITGCDAAAALEAAHLRPYRGPGSNTLSNGLPLRADIHTLLDLRLLAIEPVTRAIVVSKLLAGTQYDALTARTLTDPIADWQRPSSEVLAKAWQDFLDTEDTRQQSLTTVGSTARRCPLASTAVGGDRY